MGSHSLQVKTFTNMTTSKKQVYMKTGYTKNGVKFNELCQGLVKNYCCDSSIVLDHDIMQLINPNNNILDLFRNAIAGHSKRIISQIEARSGCDIDQFCFGCVYTEPRSEFGSLDVREHKSWTKEGISTAWRKLKKSCCSLCCMDTSCSGCRSCLCRSGPVRGGYDGLIVLSCLTRSAFPTNLLMKLPLSQLVADMILSLSVLFMQDNGKLGQAIVHGDIKHGPDTKNCGYCLYIGYRLSGVSTRRSAILADRWSLEEDDITDDDGDDEVEEVRQKMEADGVNRRLTLLTEENKKLQEAILRIEDSKMDLEGRVISLETQLST